MSGTLADVMQSCPPCVDAGLSISDLIEVFETTQSPRVLVVAGGKLVGAICASEVMGTVCFCSERTAGDIAGRHVLTASRETEIARAVAAFQNGVDRFIVVLSDGEPVGCIRPNDLFGWARDSAEGNPVRRPHLLQRSSEHADGSVRPTC